MTDSALLASALAPPTDRRAASAARKPFITLCPICHSQYAPLRDTLDPTAILIPAPSTQRDRGRFPANHSYLDYDKLLDHFATVSQNDSPTFVAMHRYLSEIFTELDSPDEGSPLWQVVEDEYNLTFPVIPATPPTDDTPPPPPAAPPAAAPTTLPAATATTVAAAAAPAATTTDPNAQTADNPTLAPTANPATGAPAVAGVAPAAAAAANAPAAAAAPAAAPDIQIASETLPAAANNAAPAPTNPPTPSPDPNANPTNGAPAPAALAAAAASAAAAAAAAAHTTTIQTRTRKGSDINPISPPKKTK
jgi:hypothetical protein